MSYLQEFDSQLEAGADRLLFLWDAQRGDNLGTLILTLAAGVQLRDHLGLSAIDVLAFGGGEALNGNPEHPFRRLCAAMEGVETVACVADSTEAAQRVAALSDTHLAWPGVEYWRDGEADTSFRLQEAFSATGKLAPLRLRSSASEKARLRLRQFASPGTAVHLKNVEGAQSNADHHAWQAFFTRVAGSGHFVLIGDDLVPPDISGLPNVTLAREIDGDLVFYLALMQESEFFMGMMSGPCTLALVNGNPYRIFKNPDHHAREMDEELGKANRYPFAFPNQKIIRQRETPDLLLREFGSMVG